MRRRIRISYFNGSEVGDLIPDFALKPHNQHAFCDLLELKRPSAKLVVGQDNRRRLSAAVMASGCSAARVS